MCNRPDQVSLDWCQWKVWMLEPLWKQDICTVYHRKDGLKLLQQAIRMRENGSGEKRSSWERWRGGGVRMHEDGRTLNWIFQARMSLLQGQFPNSKIICSCRRGSCLLTCFVLKWSQKESLFQKHCSLNLKHRTFSFPKFTHEKQSKAKSQPTKQ